MYQTFHAFLATKVIELIKYFYHLYVVYLRLKIPIRILVHSNYIKRLWLFLIVRNTERYQDLVVISISQYMQSIFGIPTSFTGNIAVAVKQFMSIRQYNSSKFSSEYSNIMFYIMSQCKKFLGARSVIPKIPWRLVNNQFHLIQLPVTHIFE